MKKVMPYILIAAVSAMFVSCLKEGLNKGTGNGSGNATILGNWSIVNDTTTTGFWGIWNGKSSVGVNYIGVPGDYYNFSSNNKLYISQNGQKDTEVYKINKDSIAIKYAYIDGSTNIVDSTYGVRYIISNLSAHTATLTSFFISPETVINSTVNLKR
jgi:hypothetical protein